MAKVQVDTPRKGAWHTKVNQPGFVSPAKEKKGVVIRTIGADEYAELAPILNGPTHANR